MQYIILVGGVMVILVPLFHYALSNTAQNIKLSQAEDLIRSLGKAVDDVYALSPGTKKYVWVSVPGGVEDAQVTASEISLTLNVFGSKSDITAVSNAPLTGDIPDAKGTYRIPVEHLESGIVLIGSGNDTTAPVFTFTSPSGPTTNPISLRADTDESARCKFDSTDTSYQDMSFQMIGSGVQHTYDLGVQPSGSYTYYVRCSDAFDNVMTSSAVIAFSI